MIGKPYAMCAGVMLRNIGSFAGLRQVALSILSVASLFVCCQFSAFAAGSVILSWNPSTDANVVGYRIYYGAASRTYTNVVDAGEVTSAAISNLVEGATYYFAATAYNILGLESDYSDETSYTVPLSTVVNQPPTLDAVNNLTITEGAGMQTVNLAGISTGASNEVQTLAVTASSSNPALIPTPTITYTSPNATGTLRFTPVALASGVATITVTVNDGGASNNIVTRTFTVTVNAVNNAPTLNTLTNRTIAEGAGLQTVNLAGISSGASNEVQTLTLTATSSNPGLIPNPSVNYTSPNTNGTLTFTPVPQAFGSATITVTVNDGGASNNIVTRSFTVTVSANTPPVITAITNQIIATNAVAGPIPFTIGDAETPATNLIVWATSSSSALVPTNSIVFGGSSSNRTVTLTPLANQTGDANITITVSDGVATASTTFQFFVLGPPTPPSMLTVVMNGNGSVTPNLAGQSLAVGRKYTLTATPGADQLFIGWSGSMASTYRTISFTMQSNLLLQANFIPNPFIAASGNYNGLFHEDDEVRLNRSGFFRIMVSSRGTYSGWLLLGARRHSFSGMFNLQGQATNSIIRRGDTPLTLELNVGGAQGDEISGRLTDGDWISSLGAKRSTFNARLNPAPQTGLYTLVVPGQTSDPASPMGSSYGMIRVDGNGVVRFIGAMSDGTRVSQSAMLSRDGQWPFYVPLYAGGGQVMSWITFTNLPASDLNGTLSWIKLANPRARYPGGFTNEHEAVGSAYTAPTGANHVLNFVNSRMDFIGGDLASDLSVALVVGPKNTQASGPGLSMTFYPASGLYYGRALDPATSQWFNFGGAVLQKVNAGYGYLLGPTQSSQAVLTP